MHFPFLHPITNNHAEEEPPVVRHEQDRGDYDSEGGEFLDDALRMEDLTLPRTEEFVAAGTPAILL